jgi:hypothetical protein
MRLLIGKWFNGSSKYTPEPGAIPGTVLTLRGVTVTLVPLCLDDFVALESEFAGFGDMPLGKQMIATAKVAHRSMLAHHPDISFDEVRQLIDVRNMPEVMRAVISMNELASGKPGEQKPAGQ